MERSGFDTWKAKEVARLLALLEGERRYYQEITAAFPIPVAVLAADRTVAWANRAFRRAAGLSGEELRGRAIEQILSAEDLGGWIEQLHAGRGHAIEAKLGAVAYRLTGAPLIRLDDTSETLLVLELAGEAAEREKWLVPRELPAVIWQADASTLAFRWVAGAGLEQLGYTAGQWMARPDFFEQRIHAEDRAAVMALYRAALQSEGSATAEFRMIAASGQAVWCRESVKAGAGTLAGVLTAMDARKQIERQLCTAERLEALQTFAGRLAHDLNNPLMIATGYADELLQALPASSPLRAEASELAKATARLSEVAARLTEFARRPEAEPAPVNVGETLAALEPRLRQAAGLGATFETVAAAGPVWALAGAELGQVLETLAGVCAADRHRFMVAWDVEEVAERTSPATLPPGRYACVRLRSYGAPLGLRPTAVFDPGPPGKPGSFQLALAYLNVRRWGGDIAFSAEAESCCFCLYLPLAQPAPAAAAQAAPAATPRPASILVVDDEAGIRGLVLKALRRANYEVIEAASAESALQVAAARGAPIDLLLTDVVLSGMSGPELARRMHAAQPSLKVLYISGYAPEEIMRGPAHPPGARLLAKPFTLAALLEAVREALKK